VGSVTRVYVPLVWHELRSLVADGALPAGMPAYAVTPALVDAEPAGTDEQEELAWQAAVDASLAALTADVPPRRVVVSADVPAASVVPAPELGPAAVRLTDGATRHQVACAHVDDPAAANAVAVARRGTPADLDDVDLLWYAEVELDALVAD